MDAVAKVLVLAQAGDVIAVTVELGGLSKHVSAADFLSLGSVSFQDALQHRFKKTHTALGHIGRELLGDHSRCAGEGKDGSDGELHGEVMVRIVRSCHGMTEFEIASRESQMEDEKPGGSEDRGTDCCRGNAWRFTVYEVGDERKCKS